MRKQFGTYEIALSLRKLGFKERCIGMYCPEFSLLNVGMNWNVKNLNDINHEYCSAPLYQQIIDWFREKYELIIDSPKPDIWNKGRWSVRVESMNEIIILESIVDQPYWIIYRCYKSYEEAREQSILKVLKLIKEQNKNE